MVCQLFFFFPAQFHDALASFVSTNHDLRLAQKLSGVKSGEITRVEKPRNKVWMSWDSQGLKLFVNIG